MKEFIVSFKTLDGKRYHAEIGAETEEQAKMILSQNVDYQEDSARILKESEAERRYTIDNIPTKEKWEEFPILRKLICLLLYWQNYKKLYPLKKGQIAEIITEMLHHSKLDDILNGKLGFCEQNGQIIVFEADHQLEFLK